MLSRLEFRAEFGLEAFAEVRNPEVWPFGFSNAGVRSTGLQLFQSSLACVVFLSMLWLLGSLLYSREGQLILSII